MNTDYTDLHRYCFLGRKRGEGISVERVMFCVLRFTLAAENKNEHE